MLNEHLVIDDLFQLTQMVAADSDFGDDAAFFQHTGIFFGQQQRKHGAKTVKRSVCDWQIGSGSDCPENGFVPAARHAHAFLCDIDSDAFRTAGGFDVGSIVALAAADIGNHSAVREIFFECLDDILTDRLIHSAVKKPSSGKEHFFGIARRKRMLVLHRQQIDIALLCDIKAVAFSTEQTFSVRFKGLSADRTDQTE